MRHQILFLVHVLIQGQVLAKLYQKSVSNCKFQNKIYKSLKVASSTHCSVLCNEDHLCSRFIYDSTTNMCDLHSDTNMKPEAEITPSGKSLYISTHKDCRVQGYDFIEPVNLCFKKYNTEYNWHDARELCKRDGGDLISLDRLDRWKFFYQHLDTCNNEKIWLGLYNRTWVNGSPFQDIYNVTSLMNRPLGKSCGRIDLFGTYVLLENDCIAKTFRMFCEIRIN